MEIISISNQALMITVFVFVMMLLVDFIDTVSERRLSALMQGGRWRQYTLASFLGSTPGCLGAFMNVSLYVHGVITFGAQLIGLVPCEACRAVHCDHCLTETRNTLSIGDLLKPGNLLTNIQSLSFARFLLLTLIGSFFLLVVTGMLGPNSWGWKRITFMCLSLCSLYIALVASEHYLQEHIWDHLIKKHLFRVFLWSFGALFIVYWGLAFWNLEAFIQQNLVWVLVIGALMGLIPESGPHLVFVMMYAQGLIPFSVLFTTSFVQDGHGMLPLLSYSIKDSVLIKIFNLIFGLAVGGTLYVLGL
ncbi:MAG: putative manganese transporter [Deltaproteobacteria bacterium]